MITKIELINFRRHKYTNIVCQPGEQVICVSGNNGTGKSTLFEAVNYALFGEGRNGARGLDSLVRRGDGDIEGMQVTVGLHIDGQDYEIVRRRQGRGVTAILRSGDGADLISGTRAVTDAVVELLGVDAAGWRLATYARQKELDALTKLGDVPRARAIGRLLRLDAVGRAAASARSTARRNNEIVSALGVETVAAAAAEVTRREAVHKAAAAREAAGRATIDELSAQVAATSDDATAHHNAQLAAERAQGLVEGTLARIGQLEAELEALAAAVDDVGSGDVGDVDELKNRGHQLDLSIAAANEAKRAATRKATIERELAAITARLDELDSADAADGNAAEAQAAVTGLEQQLAEARDVERGAAENRARIVEAHVDARTREVLASQALADAATIGATCDRCGQDVDDETRQRLHAERHGDHTAAQALVAKLAGDLAVADDAIAAAADSANAIRTQLTAAEAKLRDAAVRAGERAALAPQQKTYAAQLERFDGNDGSELDDLLAERGRVGLAIAAATAAADAAAAAKERAARREAIGAQLAALNTKLAEQRAAVDASGPNAELEAAAARHREATEALRGELALLGDLSAAAATAAAEVTAARERLTEVSERAAKRDRFMHEAVVASDAANLLGDLETTLGASIRPSLEAAVSDLLAQLSDNRFVGVRFGAAYTIEVDDNGAWRGVDDLSGGEADLVALAVRLGLAELAGSRTGVGPRILILDEILGSQDTGRREAIMTTLRALRDRYSQIWCISHVGGIEDGADRVLEVRLGDDGACEVDG